MDSAPNTDRHSIGFSGLTVRGAKNTLIKALREGGIDLADSDGHELLQAVLEKTSDAVIIDSGQILTSNEALRLNDYLSRRLSGEPVDHILGERTFFGRAFKIDKTVLSPRGDTEILVDHAIRFLSELQEPRILDLGTGSGAIAITLLAEVIEASVMATDISGAALEMTNENALRHGVQARLDCRQGSWFDPVSGLFDLIISNPPYITDSDMLTLEAEVLNYDPALALRGGPDGLDSYRLIISRARKFLKPKGRLFFEVGFDQGKSVPDCLRAVGFQHIDVIKDYAGHDRIVTACNF